MKIGLFTDVHASRGMGSDLKKSTFAQASELWYSHKMNIIIKSFEWMIKEFQGVDLIVCLGDVFQRYAKMDMFIFNIIEGLFERLAKVAPVVIITGNHDIMNEIHPNYNALTPFKLFTKVIHGKADVDYVQAINTVFYYVPYFSKGDDLRRLYAGLRETDKHPEGVRRVLFGHHDLKQFNKWTDTSDTQPGDKTYGDLKINWFDKAFFGHIHWRAEHKNATTIGSLITRTFHDRDDLDRGITILDITAKEFKESFIRNPHSPLYITVESGADLKKVKEARKEGRIVCAEVIDAVAFKPVSEHVDFMRLSSNMKKTFEAIVKREGITDIDEISDWKSYLDVQLTGYMEGEKLKPEQIEEFKKLFGLYLEKAQTEEVEEEDE